MPDELVMLTDVQARRDAASTRMRVRVLAPVGAWLGRGALRVLRVKTLDDEALELTLGYESYEKFAA